MLCDLLDISPLSFFVTIDISHPFCFSFPFPQLTLFRFSVSLSPLAPALFSLLSSFPFLFFVSSFSLFFVFSSFPSPSFPPPPLLCLTLSQSIFPFPCNYSSPSSSCLTPPLLPSPHAALLQHQFRKSV